MSDFSGPPEGGLAYPPLFSADFDTKGGYAGPISPDSLDCSSVYKTVNEIANNWPLCGVFDSPKLEPNRSLFCDWTLEVKGEHPHSKQASNLVR